MSAFRTLAPAKVNLGLFVGPIRAADGRHELVSVMQSISLADELLLERAGAGAGEDEVHCPGVPSPASENLAARALAAFRERTGWDAPPQRLSVRKRVPVAAGLGGGSADAAAALRLAARASGLGGPELLLELGLELGADVPAQISPGCWLASGAGERLAPLAGLAANVRFLVLRPAAELSTGAVYGEADRLGLPREAGELARRREDLLGAWTGPRPRGLEELGAWLLHNDLQAAALSLCPEIEEQLERARRAGAEVAFVSGSGPTVIGLFTAAELPGAEPLAGALWASPVDASFARVSAADPGDRGAGGGDARTGDFGVRHNLARAP